MRTHLWRLASVVMLLTLLFIPLAAPAAVSAATLPEAPITGGGIMQVIAPSAMGKLESLAATEPLLPTQKQLDDAAALRERFDLPKAKNAVKSEPTDASVVQDSPIGNNMPAALANFDGVGNVNGVLPPDTNGDIGYDSGSGNKYYMQWVNLSFQIWKDRLTHCM